MELPKVSVIVPLYNAEKTLHKCLDSLTNQTLKDWELILVDDGSSDSSDKICENYARNDKRIHVIHKPNGGVGSARQAGLEVCKGEYVIHVDSDDWIETDMLEVLYSNAITDNADIVICDFYTEHKNVSNYIIQHPTSLKAKDVLNDILIYGRLHGSCWNKLVKKKCIDKYNVNFNIELHYGEDVCFNVQLLKHNVKISYVDSALYHYVQHSSSITNSYTKESLKHQQDYVTQLGFFFPKDSLPLILSKEAVKEIAFRYSLMDNMELEELYPEIRNVHKGNIICRFMYRLAFTGHYRYANILKYIYWKYQNSRRA